MNVLNIFYLHVVHQIKNETSISTLEHFGLYKTEYKKIFFLFF